LTQHRQLRETQLTLFAAFPLSSVLLLVVVRFAFGKNPDWLLP